MRVVAIVLCFVAVAAMAAAIRDMVLGSDEPRRGWALRTVPVVAFATAVVLGAIAAR
jgi:hypothetical protein